MVMPATREWLRKMRKFAPGDDTALMVLSLWLLSVVLFVVAATAHR